MLVNTVINLCVILKSAFQLIDLNHVFKHSLHILS